MSNNDFLQHTVTALAYRFTKATAHTGHDFGTFRAGQHSRTPCEIINHMTDLARKSASMLREGHFNCPPPEPCDFQAEKGRFEETLQLLSETIQATEIASETGMRLLQGPLLDMATHIGQLAMLNGLNGNRVAKENYFSANMSEK